MSERTLPRWKPTIIRGFPDYVCPYCGHSMGSICPLPFCGNCGKALKSGKDFRDDFEKSGTWKVKEKAT